MRDFLQKHLKKYFKSFDHQNFMFNTFFNIDSCHDLLRATNKPQQHNIRRWYQSFSFVFVIYLFRDIKCPRGGLNGTFLF